MSSKPSDRSAISAATQTCESSVIRQHSRSFWFASLLLPTSVRDDVRKLYAWCRWCDDTVDAAASLQVAEQHLQILREDVLRITRGEAVHHSASRWLADLVQAYNISEDHALALLDAMEMDLRLRQVADRAELIKYCYGAAGVVGLMLCQIFKVDDPRAKQHASALGMAMQLTNIARDVLEDAQRGRCYIPKTWLRADWDTATSRAVRRSVRKLLDLAEHYYHVAEAGMRYLPAEIRPAIRVAAAVYREIGMEIRRQNYAVMQGRIVTSKARFAATAFTSLVRGLTIDVRNQLASMQPKASLSAQDFPTVFSVENAMKDAKYLAWLGLSLTAIMGGALFLLVLFNPKDPSYSYLPLAYAIACFLFGAIANMFAKQNESPEAAPVPMRIRTSREQE